MPEVAVAEDDDVDVAAAEAGDVTNDDGSRRSGSLEGKGEAEGEERKEEKKNKRKE